MNNETFDLAFFKNISFNDVEFDDVSPEEGKEKLNQMISFANSNKETFENKIISACSGVLDFDYTFGDDETDDEMFEERLGEYLLIPCSRTEYQNLVKTYNKELYDVSKTKQQPGTFGVDISEEDERIYVIDRMRKIVDYDKLFSNITPFICVGEEFSIEISDGDMFDDPVVVYFDYNVKVKQESEEIKKR
ncbi:MAG: hypothetical protein J5970_01680 [Bacilli bacterium]|nr:hypothetical protein [Bacilli bacterium]